MKDKEKIKSNIQAHLKMRSILYLPSKLGFFQMREEKKSHILT